MRIWRRSEGRSDKSYASFVKYFILFILAIILVTCIGTANAKERDKKFRIITLHDSHHHMSNGNHNETHNGIGIGVRVGKLKYIEVLNYDNSGGKNGNLLAFTSEKQISKYFFIGAGVGGANNYKDRDIMPYAAITFRLGFVRTIHVPSVVSAWGFVF